MRERNVNLKMNSAVSTSYFTRIKIPTQSGPIHRTGLIVAHNDPKGLHLPTKELLVMVYITDKEKNELDINYAPWGVNFPSDGVGNFKDCEVRRWEEAGGGGRYVFLSERHYTDEDRVYQLFADFAAVKTIPQEGKVCWSTPSSLEIQTNDGRQVMGNALSYRLGEQAKNNDDNNEMAAAYRKEKNLRDLGDKMCQLLVGAPVFLKSGLLAGFCYDPEVVGEAVYMNYSEIGFDISKVLEECGKSKTYEAVKNEESFQSIEWPDIFIKIAKEVNRKNDLDHDMHKIYKNDFASLFKIDGEFFSEYFNATKLEYFLLHTKSSLKRLLDGLNQWKSMLFSLSTIGKTARTSLVLLYLLSGFSTKSHGKNLADGLCTVIDCSVFTPPHDPELGEAVRLKKIKESYGETWPLIERIYKIRERNAPPAGNEWHMPFTRFQGKGSDYKFANSLKNSIQNLSERQKVCELIDSHFHDGEDFLRRPHAGLAFSFQFLVKSKETFKAMSEGTFEAISEDARANLSPEWQDLLDSIDEDIFCLKYPERKNHPRPKTKRKTHLQPKTI